MCLQVAVIVDVVVDIAVAALIGVPYTDVVTVVADELVLALLMLLV